MGVPPGEEIMAANPLEIPQSMRDLAEQNLKQAHVAYGRLTDFMTQAMNAWMGALPADPMAIGFKNVQDHAMEFVTRQTQFAQDCIQAFFAQTQQLYSQIQEVSEKSEHGAVGGAALKYHGHWLQGCTEPCRRNREEECRVSFRAGREDS
jgi:phage terminase large subunit-like protein